MKTAVEWLIDEHFGGIENCTPDFRFHIEQAKEMEKEEKETYKYTEFDLISAFEYGWNQRHYGVMDEDELQQIQKRFIQSINETKKQEQ
jgi:hypothetical protein